jgi:secreted trypsin-like serine protease
MAAIFTIAAFAEAVGPAVVLASQRDRDSRPGVAVEGKSERQDGKDARSQRAVDSEVIGGRVVTPGSSRYMAMVYSTIGRDTYECGGTLVAPRYVMTAAHCVVDDYGNLLGPSAFTLVIGKLNLKKIPASNKWRVTRVVPHPSWSLATMRNDVALLQLDRAVPPAVARPVTVVGSGQTRYDKGGQLAAVMGWGVTEKSRNGSSRLLTADLNVVADANCNAKYGGGLSLDVMICAAAPNRDSCYGDSGGPLLAKEFVGYESQKVTKKKKNGKKRVRYVNVPTYQETQIGIVSFGAICADPNSPGIYTRLSTPAINDFIIRESSR